MLPGGAKWIVLWRSFRCSSCTVDNGRDLGLRDQYMRSMQPIRCCEVCGTSRNYLMRLVVILSSAKSGMPMLCTCHSQLNTQTGSVANMLAVVACASRLIIIKACFTPLICTSCTAIESTCISSTASRFAVSSRSPLSSLSMFPPGRPQVLLLCFEFRSSTRTSLSQLHHMSIH